jgi:microcystin-dependent protein
LERTVQRRRLSACSSLVKVATFQTGDGRSTAVSYILLKMPHNNWFKQSVVGALSLMTVDANWIERGDQTTDDATDIASEMVQELIVVDVSPFPAGRVVAFAGTTTPEGWLSCDGASYAIADYEELYAAIGTTWGGSGGNFNVPDLRNRVAVGAGDDFSISDVGGTQTETLDLSEIPAHDHVASGTSVVDLGHTHVESGAIPTAILIGAGVPAPSAIPSPSVTGAGFANLSVTDPTISSSGGGGSHNNMQPFTALNYIIYAGV